MRRSIGLVVAACLAGGGALGAAHLLGGRAIIRGSAVPVDGGLWTETTWTLPKDPWGRGKAFRCSASSCGTEVVVHVRAKIGLCGCVTSIDDDDVDRMSDIDLMAPERSSLGPGRSFKGRWMSGRSRS